MVCRGLAVTLLSYSIATTSGGGIYIIARGAVFFGLRQFLYGVILYTLERFPLRLRTPGPVRVKTPSIQQPLHRPSTPAPQTDPPGTLDRWIALLRYDDQIRAAAQQLRPFGERWIGELRQAFFALNEDKRYLPKILARLTDEAQAEKTNLWRNQFRTTHSGETCTEASLNILRDAISQGYTLSVTPERTFLAAKGPAVSYLRSNYDIERFGRLWRPTKTRREFAEEYRPYNAMHEFSEGTMAYLAGNHRNPYPKNSVQAQAWDSGLQCCRRYEDQEGREEGGRPW
jgi:hypothetical protein